MPAPDWYIVNVNEDRSEVIHRDPPTPRCDVSHIVDDLKVDLASVNALIDDGKAKWCRHCYPDQ